MPLIETIVFSLLGGLLPALLWLWFFLREDKERPEPARLIGIAFIAGMGCVIVALVLESIARAFVTDLVLLISLWAIIEEVCKWLAAYFFVLRNRVCDEPVDAMIYLITVALGFAAFETAFFMFSPLLEGEITASLLTGNLRFMGAALLHTLASGVVGAAIAFSFYKNGAIKKRYLFTGLILASVLHAAFNLSIMNVTGQNVIYIFFFVWIGIVTLFLAFEKAKRITSS